MNKATRSARRTGWREARRVSGAKMNGAPTDARPPRQRQGVGEGAIGEGDGLAWMGGSVENAPPPAG